MAEKKTQNNSDYMKKFKFMEEKHMTGKNNQGNQSNHGGNQGNHGNHDGHDKDRPDKPGRDHKPGKSHSITDVRHEEK